MQNYAVTVRVVHDYTYDVVSDCEDDAIIQALGLYEEEEECTEIDYSYHVSDVHQLVED
jgi:hypothetical protein